MRSCIIQHSYETRGGYRCTITYLACFCTSIWFVHLLLRCFLLSVRRTRQKTSRRNLNEWGIFSTAVRLGSALQFLPAVAMPSGAHIESAVCPRNHTDQTDQCASCASDSYKALRSQTFLTWMIGTGHFWGLAEVGCAMLHIPWGPRTEISLNPLHNRHVVHNAITDTLDDSSEH